MNTSNNLQYTFEFFQNQVEVLDNVLDVDSFLNKQENTQIRETT